MYPQFTLSFVPIPTAAKRESCLNAFGNKCERCGYSRCVRALQFHHKNAEFKKEWSKTGRASYQEIVAYPERFELLCANCHFEEHDAQDRARRVYQTCQHCGKEYRSANHLIRSGRSKYCSKQCQHRSLIKPRAVVEIHKPTFSERFWEKVNKTDGCWLWTSYTQPGGTAIINTKGKNGKTRPRCASRVAYELEYGPIPSGQMVLQSCDNASCVRPEHLFLATQAEKGRRMSERGRSTRGEKSASSKITWEKVAAIRSRYQNTECTQKQLAEEFGLCQTTISEIIRNLIWRQPENQPVIVGAE